MARAITSRLLWAALTLQLGGAQKCYYPSGNEAAAVEKPCSSEPGSACCPDKWQCLDNGLCYYPNDNLYGRYSCTDQSWKSEGCPSNMCTYDMSATGGESITQCDNHGGQWCCNADATHVNCCQESPEPRPFFQLQDGRPYATVGANLASDAPNLASITGIALGTGGGGNNNRPSQTPSPSSDSPNQSSSGSQSPSARPENVSPSARSSFTSIQTLVSSGTAGISTVVSTVVQPAESTSTPGASPTSPQDPQKKSKLPLIIGLAVGIPLALALLGILFWLFRKRRQQNAHAKTHEHLSSPTPDMYSSPGFVGGANFEKNRNSDHGPAPDMPELMSQGVGPGRPVSAVKGRAELDSGTGFAPGAVPYAPNAVGIGGGNMHQNHSANSSWGSAPPGYSPGMNGNHWAGQHQNHHDIPAGVAEAPDTSVPRPGSGGAGAGAGGVQQTDGGRYIPYRPPQGHAAAQPGLTNVPEAVEMPTVKTPPEEKPQPGTQA